MCRRLLPLLLALAAFVAALPQTALAHGFRQRYDLPVPLWLYLYGAAAAVLLSFVIVGLFVGVERAPRGYPRHNLLRLRAFRALVNARPLILAVRLLAVGAFLLVIISGLFGNQAPAFNFAPSFVWIIWWVGLSFCTVLIGNVWPLLNPWKILFEWADALSHRAGYGGLEGAIPYPARWGVWPALLLYWTFIWIEIIFEGAPAPANIALFALLYSLVTWLGMARFGKDAWLRGGEAFTIFFGILGRCAPTETRVDDPALCAACGGDCATNPDGCVDCEECFAWADPEDRAITVRPPGAGLLNTTPPRFDRLLFVILMLASVTFDGLTITTLWATIGGAITPFFAFLSGKAYLVTQTLGLLAVVVLFLSIYLGFSALVRRIGGRGAGVGATAAAFIYALVPIAVAYQAAHYVSYLLIQGQRIVPLISDPLGRGWNLFGTADYTIWIEIISARTAWYVQIGAIILGHIAAVYLAHIIALRHFGDARRALWSQIPMLVLMLLYTMSSLWILSQPIINENRGGEPASTGQGHAAASAEAFLPSGWGTGTARDSDTPGSRGAEQGATKPGTAARRGPAATYTGRYSPIGSDSSRPSRLGARPGRRAGTTRRAAPIRASAMP